MKTNTYYIFILILLACLGRTSLNDCPIQYYPTQTVIGFINADLNFDPELQNKEQNFTYPIKEALSTSTPKVVVAINAMNFDFKMDLKYKVQSVSSLSFGSFNFKVLAQASNLQWKRLQFNFIATTNKNIAANTLQYILPSSFVGTKHNLIMRVDVSDAMLTKPIIQSYVSGIVLISKSTVQNIAKIQKQMDSIPKFSWNTNTYKILNQTIVNMSSIYFEITSNTLSKNNTGTYLNTELTIGDNILIQNITISYIIFNQIDYSVQQNIMSGSFSITNKSASFRFNPLDNTDFTFVGLRGINHKINTLLNIQFALSKGKTLFAFYNSQILNDGFAIHANYIQTETKFDFQCKQCPESIYKFQKSCLSQCPTAHVNVKNGPNSICKFCNVTEFFIPNADNTDCVCAKQFYFDNSLKACLPCHYTCLQCKNGKNCSTCDNVDKFTNRQLDPNTNICACKIGFYQLSAQSQLSCKKCHSTCKTCQGPAIDQCLTCVQTRVVDQTGRCQCGFNFVEQKDICSCVAPNIFLLGVCYQVQPTFSPCNKPNMKQLIIDNQKICQCIQGFIIYQNSCLSCPQNFIFNNQNGKCECPKTGFLNNEGKCLVCEINKYFDLTLQKCICKNKLFETVEGNCIECPLKSVYKDQKCQCIFNYFLQNGECVKCLPDSSDQNCARFQLL